MVAAGIISAVLIAVAALVIGALAYTMPASSGSSSTSTSGGTTSSSSTTSGGTQLITSYALNSGGSISTNPATITFDTALLTNSAFDGTTFTAPATGYYIFTGEISYYVGIPASTTVLMTTNFVVNGSTTKQSYYDGLTTYVWFNCSNLGVELSPFLSS